MGVANGKVQAANEAELTSYVNVPLQIMTRRLSPTV